MSTLRGQLIRLAHSVPETRPHLLPLIRKHGVASKEARSRKWDKTLQGEKARIRWEGHPSHYLVVEEMPTRPVKRRLRRAEFGNPFGYHSPSEMMLENILTDAKLKKTMTYEQAVAAMKKAIAKAIRDAGDKLDDWEAQRAGSLPDEQEVHYLQVEPADYKPMDVKAKDFSVHCEWNTFEAYSPDSDFQSHDPYYIYYEAKSPTAARKLFKLLKADPKALSKVSWGAFSDWLRKMKIPYGTHFSQWR